MSPAPCPHCGEPLRGLGRYCWECQKPVDTRGPKPSAAIPDTRSEEEIEQGIKADLEKLGFHVAKLSQPRRTMQTEGVSDLVVFGFGATVFAEIKKAGGEQSTNQRRFESWVRMGGGSYEVWRSEADALNWAAGVMGRTQTEESA